MVLLYVCLPLLRVRRACRTENRPRGYGLSIYIYIRIYYYTYYGSYIHNLWIAYLQVYISIRTIRYTLFAIDFNIHDIYTHTYDILRSILQSIRTVYKLFAVHTPYIEYHMYNIIYTISYVQYHIYYNIHQYVYPLTSKPLSNKTKFALSDQPLDHLRSHLAL